MEELLTTTEVAEFLDLERDSVYMWLHRSGLKPVAREPGNHGENQYRKSDIVSYVANRKAV